MSKAFKIATILLSVLLTSFSIAHAQIADTSSVLSPGSINKSLADSNFRRMVDSVASLSADSVRDTVVSKIAVNHTLDTLLKRKDTSQTMVGHFDPYKAITYLKQIPFNRRYFHEDKIDKQIRKADAWDGVIDSQITRSADTLENKILTRAILTEANFLQIMIENMPDNGRDSFSDHQDRIRCLNAVERLLSTYNTDTKPDARYYLSLVRNLHDMIIAYNEDKMWSFTVKNVNKLTVENSRLIYETHKDVRAYLFSEMGKQEPLWMIKRLPEFGFDTFAGRIVAAVAQTDPDIIFNYATSTNRPISYAISHTNDSFVKAIRMIATGSKNPVRAMAFLGEVYRGQKNITEVDQILDDSWLYFRNLVRLRIENDSIGRQTYTNELELRTLRFIREMNELHDTNDAVRFKGLDPLNAEELFYVIVYGQDEIYTSSFLGAFKRLLVKMQPHSGDQLFANLNYDHFRTFIRMCAGYNTLSEFLATMPDTVRTTVMSRFIDNLYKGAENDLEDAVDVADAFGSITDTALTSFLQQKVKENYELSYKLRSKKGMIIYSLLARLFEGNRITDNDTGASLVADRLGLSNISKIPFYQLANDSGIVYQQVFFYGDEDGQKSYAHFLELFRRDKRWAINIQPFWVEIASTNGKKIKIYANQPLPEPQDDEAIHRLNQYLSDTGVVPTIMIHRGHSYHLKTTLAYLQPKTRMVILGSCGGYNNLAEVLNKSPDAHIVSSKQTGTMGVNDEILRSLNNMLIDGKDPNWIGIWRGLEEYFRKKHDASEKDKFSDYVPPHKNLGAIFIKAYRKMNLQP